MSKPAQSRIKTIHLAVPGTAAARQFDRFHEGCYYITINLENGPRTWVSNNGPYISVLTAEEFADVLYPQIPFCRDYRDYPLTGSKFENRLQPA